MVGRRGAGRLSGGGVSSALNAEIGEAVPGLETAS